MKSIITTRPVACRMIWSAGIATAIMVITGLNALGQLVYPFAPGNLVLERVGNGSAALTGNGTPIFLDQYTTSGSLVSSEMIPTNGASMFVDVGNSTTEGFSSISPYGTNLFLAGYNVAAGFTAPNSATAASAPRAVATVDYNGNYSLVTVNNTAFSGGNIRSATGDGTTNYWGSGSVTGTIYLGTGTANTISTTVANERVIQEIGGNLYYSTGSGSTRGIYKISGTPVSGANTAVSLINNGASASPYGYEFNPALTVCYVADSTTFSTSSGIGGIEKWTYNGSVWAFQYSLAPGTGNGADSVAVDWTTTPATIYATTANGNYLVKVQDNGAGTVAITNAITPANTAFRSVIFAPTNTVAASAAAPSLTGISPATLTAPSGGTATFTLSGFAGNPVASNNWYQVIGSSTNLYSNQIGALTLTNLVAGSYSYFAILTNVSGSATSSVVSLTVTPNPSISAITPLLVATNAGSTVVFSLTDSPGTPPATNFWYSITNSVTNLLYVGPVTSLTLTNVATNSAGYYFAILTNLYGSATSSLAQLVITNFPPVITGIGPASVTTNAGQIVSFTVTNSGTAPFSYLWFEETSTATNLISTTTNSTLTLTNITITNSAANYQVVVSNLSTLSVTSTVVSLTVIDDPNIQVEPVNVEGLLDGTAQFGVTVAGSAPLSYQWYYSDTNGNIIAPVGNGSLGASVISGATSSILSIADLQNIDLTNFVVVATNMFGSVTSTAASFLSISNGPAPALAVSQGVLALWDFDGIQFSNTAANPNCLNNPAPFVGFGAASVVGTPLVSGTSPFVGTTTADPSDQGYDANSSPPGYVFTPFGFDQPSPNFSWGTEDYPAATNFPAGVANGGNKQNGIQFTVSTAGARNIHVAYDARVSSTASDYERLQYTTNGTTWIDYPASTTFSGIAGGSGVNTGWFTFDYSLVGFPGVDNNTNFGIRVVTEWESTATYGIGTTNNWVATANASYDSGASGNYAGGTMTYDLVAITGDAITNNNVPPTLSSFVDTNMVDTNTLVIPFTASSPQMVASKLTFSVQSLNTVSAATFSPTINPFFTVANTGGNNFTLSINFGGNYVPDPIDAAPILMTVTDTNGLSASAWFTLTAYAINQPPTNTLTMVGATNMLANTSLTIPFFVGSSTNDPNSNFTFTVTSDNNTVIPSGNVVISGNTNTGNLFLTITPAANQAGNAVIGVAVDDNNPAEPRTVTANIACVVRPNTNVVAIDYFNYDNIGALDIIGAPYWTHLSGFTGGLQAGYGAATISDLTSENMEAQLLSSPYVTNSATKTALYYSCTIDMTTLPVTNGSYVIAFNDGSGVTADVEGLLVTTTNGAAANHYRLGIDNIVGANGTDAQIFPLDLSPNTSYSLIVQLVLSNGFSTLWVDPTNAVSQSITDTTPASSQTNLYNISEIELRESGNSEGVMNVGALTVGTTFNNVFYPPQANPETVSIAENSTGNVVSPISNDGGSDLTITSVTTPADGTATISNGTNIIYSVTSPGYSGSDSFNYTVTDDLGNTSSSTVTVNVTYVPPQANPATYSVLENSANDTFNVLTNDVLETPGGTLSLSSVSETDGNGTATKSGNNVLFTPTTGFVGTATINYTISDGTGTGNSTITVNVEPTPAPIGATVQAGGSVSLTWTNSAYGLQSATNLMGPWFTIPGAASPYTIYTTNAADFYRLVY